MSADWRGNSALLLVSVQFGMQPFLTEAFVPRDVIKSSLVILQEMVKAFFCFLVLYFSGNLSKVFKDFSFSNSIRVTLIPAIIYCTQNLLAFYAYIHLDPLTYNLINQSKIIFAAIFIKLILNKTPTNRQSIALFILFISAILLTVDTTSSNYESHPENNSKYGIIAIFTASVCSGLAGTLTQKALQSQNKPKNSLLFTSELAFWGVMFSLLRLFIESSINQFDGALIRENGFLFNFDSFTILIPVAINGIGGIGVGLITKYTSVIHKSYALIMGILLSGVFRSFWYSTPMTNAMYTAVPLVMISLWLNADTSKFKKQKVDKKEQ